MSETTADFDLIVMDEVNCADCGIRFGLPANLLVRRRDDSKAFWCPNGHGNHFPKPPKDRDEELEELRVTTQQAKDALAAERAAHEQTKATKRPLLRRRT